MTPDMHAALCAVQTVARANGRDWKHALSVAWATGAYWRLKGIVSNSDPLCGLLQGVRNSPAWGPGSRFWETVKLDAAKRLEWRDEVDDMRHTLIDG
ncbi:hypothetical protein QTI51_09700 [Variovorax sp. J22G73]|uniref:hypothetical protein n=1 Tax=unclassified Variovorax TaxID=663243 RepID=UPI002576577B|nr:MULTISPECIES: hypothetical protein [unclassified Variovorax]MDM0006426.1 hypothetical protein [Variovorax sp. J22R203]MDM0097551.1 hypothetical protein [Variovorax sp. J22G73]